MSIGIKNSIFANHFQSMTVVTQKAGKQKSSVKKKSLGYNPRELSGMLMGAKSAQSAAMVQIRAKSKQAMLQKALASGQYNEKQVKMAIAHAKRIAECARIKVKNLKEEEQMRQQNEKELKENILKQALKRKRSKNRNYENGKIQAANRKYYEDQMRETSEGAAWTCEGAVLELSGMGAETVVAVTASEAEMASMTVDVTL